MKFLTPFVNWGQDQQTIYVNVDLKDAEVIIQFNNSSTYIDIDIICINI